MRLWSRFFFPVFFALIAAAGLQIILLRAGGALVRPSDIATTIIAAILWFLTAPLVDAILWFKHLPAVLRATSHLAAVCLGVSIRPFCWELGRASDPRKPGQGVMAFGCLRFWWRFMPTDTVVTVVSGSIDGAAVRALLAGDPQPFQPSRAADGHIIRLDYEPEMDGPVSLDGAATANVRRWAL